MLGLFSFLAELCRCFYPRKTHNPTHACVRAQAHSHKRLSLCLRPSHPTPVSNRDHPVCAPPPRSHNSRPPPSPALPVPLSYTPAPLTQRSPSARSPLVLFFLTSQSLTPLPPTNPLPCLSFLAAQSSSPLRCFPAKQHGFQRAAGPFFVTDPWGLCFIARPRPARGAVVYSGLPGSCGVRLPAHSLTRLPLGPICWVGCAGADGTCSSDRDVPVLLSPTCFAESALKSVRTRFRRVAVVNRPPFIHSRHVFNTLVRAPSRVPSVELGGD